MYTQTPGHTGTGGNTDVHLRLASSLKKKITLGVRANVTAIGEGLILKEAMNTHNENETVTGLA